MGSITIKIQNGGLGLAAPNNSQSVVVMGCCSATDGYTLQSFSQISDLTNTLGYGPAVEAAAYQLAVAGGSVYVMPVAKTHDGYVANGGVLTPTRVGSSDGYVSVSGKPNDYYKIVVLVSSLGTGQKVTNSNVSVQVSLDGGQNYGGMKLIPASGTLALSKAVGAVKGDTGLTLTFAVGSYKYDQGDTFAVNALAPWFSTTDLAAAFAALETDPRTWGLVHVVGYNSQIGDSAADATAAAAQSTAIISGMTAAAANFRFARAIMGVPNSTDADIISAFAGVGTDPRLIRCATTDQIQSVITGMVIERPHSFGLVARLALINASRSPGIIDDGALPGVISTNRDERRTPGLYDLGFDVARTVLGRSGVYCDLGRGSDPSTSDFSLIMNGRVMDLVATACTNAALHFQNTIIKVTSTGKIDPVEAATINAYTAAQIVALAGTEISGPPTVSVYVADNILSTQKLRIAVSVIPFGYATNVEMDIGFTNPALTI
jgi:hypothetical protein